jgi:hypothetical protein
MMQHTYGWQLQGPAKRHIRCICVFMLFASVTAADLLFGEGEDKVVRSWIQTYHWKALDTIYACCIVLWRLVDTAELYSSSKVENRSKACNNCTGPSFAARDSAIAVALSSQIVFYSIAMFTAAGLRCMVTLQQTHPPTQH